MFIRLYELAKKENNQELQEFSKAILKTFEDFNINGHIECEKQIYWLTYSRSRSLQSRPQV